MASDKLWQRKQESCSCEIDGSLILLDFESGKYISIDSTGVDVWNLIELPASTASIVDALLKKFDVTSEECTQSVLSFLNGLSQVGIVRQVAETSR